MTPLWELQVALYDALVAGVSSAKTYDWLPKQPEMPYVFMIDEAIKPQHDKAGSIPVTEARLTVFVLEDDAKVLKDIVDEIVTTLEPKLTLPSWRVMRQTLSHLRTYRSETLLGDRGRSADINFQFLFDRIV